MRAAGYWALTGCPGKDLYGIWNTHVISKTK